MMKKLSEKSLLLSFMTVCLIVLVSFSACTSPKPVEKAQEVKNEKSLENEIAKDIPSQEAPIAPTAKEPMRFKDGAFAGEAIPADIRGSYTLADTAFFYRIPLDLLGEAFMIPPQYVHLVRHGDFKKVYKDLARLGKELGNGSVVMFVSLFKGMPYEPHEPTYLLEMAVRILKERGKLSDDQMLYLDQHTIKLSEIGQVDFSFVEEASGLDQSTKASLENDDQAMLGVVRVDSNTTFQDLLEVGISMRLILEIIQAEKLSYTEQTIRAYCVQNGLQFSQIKDKFNQLLD
jgi:hypothetical protein